MPQFALARKIADTASEFRKLPPNVTEGTIVDDFGYFNLLMRLGQDRGTLMDKLRSEVCTNTTDFDRLFVITFRRSMEDLLTILTIEPLGELVSFSEVDASKKVIPPRPKWFKYRSIALDRRAEAERQKLKKEKEEVKVVKKPPKKVAPPKPKKRPSCWDDLKQKQRLDYDDLIQLKGFEVVIKANTPNMCWRLNHAMYGDADGPINVGDWVKMKVTTASGSGYIVLKNSDKSYDAEGLPISRGDFAEFPYAIKIP